MVPRYDRFGAYKMYAQPQIEEDDFDEDEEDDEEDEEDEGIEAGDSSGTKDEVDGNVSQPALAKQGRPLPTAKFRKQTGKQRPITSLDVATHQDEEDEDELDTTVRPSRPAPLPLRRQPNPIVRPRLVPPANPAPTGLDAAASAVVAANSGSPDTVGPSSTPAGDSGLSSVAEEQTETVAAVTTSATGVEAQPACVPPSASDLATTASTRRKAVEYLRELGASILPPITERAACLTPDRVKEFLVEQGHVFVYQDDIMYSFDGQTGVYRKATEGFRTCVATLLGQAEQEREAYHLAMEEFERPVARLLLGVVPRIDADRLLGRATTPLSMASRYRATPGADGRPRRMNADQETLNMRNGLLDVRSGVLRAHTSDHLSSIQLPFNYDPAATCPLWLNYLNLAVPDPALQAALQEWMGYTLLPTTRFEKALLLHGDGGTGKSLFSKINGKVVGDENCSALTLDDLAEKFKVIELKDKLLNLCTEVNENRPVNEGRLKAFISGDAVTGEEKYKAATVFRPYARHIICANTLPQVTDNTEAFFRRFILVPFEQKFRAEPNGAEGELPADPDLEERLTGELSGIFNWARAGMQRLLARGRFDVPASSAALIDAYREDQSPELKFLVDNCEFGPGLEVTAGELYQAYSQWCAREGERRLPNHVFGRLVARRKGVEKGKSSVKGRYYTGLTLAQLSTRGPGVYAVLRRAEGAARRIAGINRT